MGTAKKQTLNEEQMDQARKESGVGLQPIFRIWAYPYPPRNAKEAIKIKKKFLKGEYTDGRVDINVQSERWFDARRFGLLYLGVPELIIEKIEPIMTENLTRYQLRWVGNASTANVTLRMQSRRYNGKTKRATEWKDVR